MTVNKKKKKKREEYKKRIEREEEGLMAAEVSSPLADVTRSKAIYIPVGE